MRHCTTLALIVALTAAATTALANGGNKDYLQSDMPCFSLVTKSKDYCNTAIEDRDGFIWVGTQKGIFRHDGVYQHYFFQHSASRDRQANSITTLCSDTSLNMIWGAYATRNSLACIEKDNYRSYTIDYDEQLKKVGLDITHLPFYSLINYDDSLLLGGTERGLVFFNKHTGEMRGPFLLPEMNETSVTNFVTAGNQTYFTSGKHIYRLEGRPADCPVFDQLEMDDIGTVRHIDVHDDTTLIIETYDDNEQFTLYRYNLQSATIDRLIVYDGRPRSMAAAADGVWISTNTGLLFYEYKARRMRRFTTYNSNLPDNRLDGIIKSRKQPIIWICSADGLIKNDYYASKFKLFDMRRLSESSSCDMYCVHKDRHGGYWAWFLDGLFYRKQGETFFRSKRLDRFEANHAEYIDMAEDTVRDVLYLTSSEAILQYDIKNNRARHIIDHDAGVEIKTSLLLPNGKLLSVLGNGRLFVYNPGNNTSATIAASDTLMQDITAVDIDGDSLLWFADAASNIGTFNLKTHEASLIADSSLRHNNVVKLRSICRHGQRELWIATELDGLFYYLPKEGKMTRITYSDYLFTTIYCLEIDNKNNVWVGTADGIVCINNNTGEVWEYDRETYSICPKLNKGTSCVGRDGEIIMGGTNYMVEFNPANFAHNRYFPAPIVASYKYADSRSLDFDKMSYVEHFYLKHAIEVPKGIRSMLIYVRVLNYSHPSLNNFQWRLADVPGSEWKHLSTNSPIMLSNIPIGLHAIELRSCDERGVPTGNVNRIQLRKDVYFYENPVSLSLLGGFVAICIVLFIVSRSRVASRQHKMLQVEVERQAGIIRRANEKLRRSHNRIVQQNHELQRRKENLEHEVADRTADLKKALDKAAESNKLKSMFLANLSHEIRTPMNCIVGFSKLLDDDSIPPEEKEEFVHLIQESSQSLLALISDLLDVSRIESGQITVNIKPFNVVKEVRDTFKMLAIEKKNNEVEFNLDVTPDLENYTINSDKDRFRQIIINLVYNAFKFTDKGRVTLFARVIGRTQLPHYGYPITLPMPEEEQLVMVRVTDTGIGMPEDKLEVIFEPFRKLSNNKTLYPGLGLGLNIVKNLVEILRGHIWVKSKEGRGTSFSFYLPV